MNGVRSRLRDRVAVGSDLHIRLGADARGRFSPVPAAVSAFAVAEDAEWSWVVGSGDATLRVYAGVSSRMSLAALALHPSRCLEWAAILPQIGAALRRLHCLSTAPEPELSAVDRRPPDSLIRIHDFLIGAVPHGRPAALRQAFVDALPGGLFDQLCMDCEKALAPEAPVLCHGWAGLNRWFPADDGSAVGLLGEDLGWAALEHDLAAVLGQLAELRFWHVGGERFLAPAEAKDLLLKGYGAPVDDARLDAETRLAVTRHVADIAVYADCPDDEPARWALCVADTLKGHYEDAPAPRV